MLDAELIRMEMYVLGLNTSQLAALSGVPPGKISLFTGGTRSLRNDEITEIRSAIADVKLLVAAADPFPVSFKDTARVKDLIKRAKLGEFDV
jgi:hypothetical protein